METCVENTQTVDWREYTWTGSAERTVRKVT